VQKYLRPGPASIPFSNRRYWHYFPELPITNPKKGKSHFQMRIPSQAQKKTRKFRFQIEDIGIIFQMFPSKDKKRYIPFSYRRYWQYFPEKPFSNGVPITSPEKDTEIPFSNRRS
jgi:hypothetical protein